MDELGCVVRTRQALVVLFLLLCAGVIRGQSVLTVSGLKFDGVDDYAQANANVIPNTGDYTVCVWARADSLPSGYTEIVSQEAGTGGYPFFLGKSNTGWIRAIATTNVKFPTDGGWHHYAVVKDATTLRLYLDGVHRWSQASFANPAGTVFRVGRQHSQHGEYFHGAIDELSVWNQALPLLRINEYMHASLGGKEAGLLSYWQLDTRVGNNIAPAAGPHALTVHKSYVPGPTFKVTLPGRGTTPADTVQIPKGRPIYALLVSGFVQNSQLDMFHFYNFAKTLMENGAYVHYSWWNNLLAPYMERPLHASNSVPYYWDWITVGKAIPSEDHQFQDDARLLLQAIRKENPYAAIILVGHSFGGDAVTRLADDPTLGVPVDLLAPIDPVGNRTCMPYLQNWGINCDNLGAHFKRFYVVRNDWFFLPSKRQLGTNIRYLYHRWQTEAIPPFDWGFNEYFDHWAPLFTSIGGNAKNVQARVPTYGTGGLLDPTRLDGHGEIVGFRGFIPHKWFDANPIGLKAQGAWPAGLSAKAKADRVELMKQWDADSTYLDKHPTPQKPYAPAKPSYCMVSPDLSTILKTAVNLPPIADAGPDQIVTWSGSASGAPVRVDGSNSREPNGTPLTFAWTGSFGKLTTPVITPTLAPGMHWITLTVDDNTGKKHSDRVLITVRRTTPLVAPYGLGCAGTGNLTPILDAEVAPRVGEQGFKLRVTQARKGSGAQLLLGTARTQLPLGGGCDLLIGIPAIILYGVTDTQGIGIWPVPSPTAHP